jgi:hypothetical protein
MEGTVFSILPLPARENESNVSFWHLKVVLSVILTAFFSSTPPFCTIFSTGTQIEYGGMSA